MTHEIRSLMQVAETVAREAAELVRAGREGEVRVAATKTSAQDVVTAAGIGARCGYLLAANTVREVARKRGKTTLRRAR